MERKRCRRSRLPAASPVFRRGRRWDPRVPYHPVRAVHCAHQGRRFPGGRLLRRMSDAPTHREVDVADRSWATPSDSPARLNGDGPHSAARQPRLEDLGSSLHQKRRAGELTRGRGPWWQVSSAYDMAPSTAELVAPVTVAKIELTESATVTHMSIAAPTEYGRTPQALVLVRLHAVPMGTIVFAAPVGTVDAPSCTEAAWASLGTNLRSHLTSDGLSADRPTSLPADADVPQCQRDVAATDPPLISVVVATRE
jgi:hypothetical protein